MILIAISNIYVISQVLGYIALALVCFGYFLTNKTKFLIIGFISNIFYAISFLMLNSVVAFLTTIILSIKVLILFYLENKQYKTNNIILPLFFIIYIIIAIIFVRKPIDIIPIITVNIFSIGYELKNLQLMRFIFLIPNIMLIVYSLIYVNYAGVLLAVIELVSLIVAIIKYYTINKKIKNVT